MTNIRNYTDKQLLDRVEKLPTFKGWRKGKYTIWVRSDEDAFDRFDDKVYNFECLSEGKRPVFHSVNSGTTNAGAQGLKNFEKYNSLGCAVLKADHMVYGSHEFGISKGKEVYRQAKPWTYYRDNNKNEKAEEIGVEYNDIIHAHQHAAGENSTLIGGWSVACLVRNVKKEYDAWLKWMNKQTLHTVILKEFNPTETNQFVKKENKL